MRGDQDQLEKDKAVREPDEFKEVYDDLKPMLEAKDDEEHMLSK